MFMFLSSNCKSNYVARKAIYSFRSSRWVHFERFYNCVLFITLRRHQLLKPCIEFAVLDVLWPWNRWLHSEVFGVAGWLERDENRSSKQRLDTTAYVNCCSSDVSDSGVSGFWDLECWCSGNAIEKYRLNCFLLGFEWFFCLPRYCNSSAWK